MIVTKEMLGKEAVDQKDLWATPWPIFRKLNNRHRFTLDPCCLPETAQCSYYFTPEINGLKQSWRGQSVYVNPPYSRGNIDLWVRKCFQEGSQQDTNVVALLPVSTSADWFQKYCIGQGLYFVNKRIRFVNAPYTAPFSSVIVHFNHISKVSSFIQNKE